MLKVIVADNEPALRLVIARILEDIGGIGEIREASNGIQLVQMVEEYRPDVIFLDAEMPVMNGMEAAKEIYDIDPQILLIFTAASENYAYAAYKVYAIDYLIKPVNAPRIRQTIRRIKELKNEMTKTVIRQCSVASAAKGIGLCIQTVDGLKVLNLQDIILITRIERKTAIHTFKGTILTNEPLHQVKERLNSDQFFRCHKSYIINIAKVSEIIPWGHKTNLVILVNTTETAIMTIEKLREFKMICSGVLS